MGGVLTALATLAIASFTLTLKRATDRLWDAGERQLKLAAETAAAQSRDMQASIKVSDEAAKAANRSAKVAEDASIAADRAWISIRAEIIDNLRFERDRVVVGVGFDMTNVGKSPATHVDILAEFCPDVMADGSPKRNFTPLGLAS